jgi:4-hydroxybenzoate polyprenyltransferase
MTDAKTYIELFRVHQYLKNLFIFAPLFFGARLADMDALGRTFLAFVAFSLVASAVYIFNDYCDREEDQEHPEKRKRPIASGAVSLRGAVLSMAVSFSLGMAIAALVNTALVYIILAYAVLNTLYSIKIKHVALLDISVIAVGFVMRLFAGSAVTGIELSMWIVITTFLLALLLATAKRRDDVLIYINTGHVARKVIDGYSLEMLNVVMAILSSVVIVAYLMYTVSPEVIQRVGSDKLYVTAAFVVLGILRYLQVTLVMNKSGSPTRVLLTDRFLQLMVVGWLITFGAVLYF